MEKLKLVEEYSTEKYIEICIETFKWCLNKFGSPDKTITPKLKVSFDKRVKKSYGSYLNGVITVYPNICKTNKLLIRTILHEYRHFLQMPKDTNMEIYYALSRNFKYIEHPFEVDSGVFEKKHYKNCKRHLKKMNII
jgi:hypothetical protein